MYEAEKRYQTKENELLAYKEQQLTKPEVKLESEINLLRMEKVRAPYTDQGLLSFILWVKLVITFEAFFRVSCCPLTNICTLYCLSPQLVDKLTTSEIF